MYPPRSSAVPRAAPRGRLTRRGNFLRRRPSLPAAPRAGIVNSMSGDERLVEATTAKPSEPEAVWVWLKLGCISFGGPAGQVAIMHEELVERRRGISGQRFPHALYFCMALPGPA